MDVYGTKDFGVDTATGLNKQAQFWQILIDGKQKQILVGYDIVLLSPTGVVVQVVSSNSYRRYNKPAVNYMVGEVITPEVLYTKGDVIQAQVLYLAGETITPAVTDASGNITTPAVVANGTEVKTPAIIASGMEVKTPAVIATGNEVKIASNMAYDRLKASSIGTQIIASIANDITLIKSFDTMFNDLLQP